MISEQRFFAMRDGTELCISPKNNNCDEWLIVTHGIGEHFGRHQYLDELLSERYNILYYDLRGHGRSHGKKGWVSDFNLFMEDLAQLIDMLKNEFDMQKYSLYGHSMGGLIVAGFLQGFRGDLPPVKSCISAPAFKFPGLLAKAIDQLPEKVFSAISSFPLDMYLKDLVDYKYLSHDPQVLKEYKEDGLISLELSSRLILQMISSGKKVFSAPLNSPTPVYSIVGSIDGIIDPDAVCDYVRSVDSSINLRVIEGGYHELHLEIEEFKRPFIEFLTEVF